MARNCSLFLDDIYILCSPRRTRFLHDFIREKMLNVAGIQPHTGKTRCWNSAGVCLLELGIWVQVWSSRGVKVWGLQWAQKSLCNQRFEFGGRAETLGRHPLDPRPSMCMAGSVAVRGSQVSPSPPNHAAKRICCAQGHDSRILSTMEHLLGSFPGTEPQTDTLANAHEDGKARIAIRRENGSGSFLGVVGRRTSHGGQVACRSSPHCQAHQ